MSLYAGPFSTPSRSRNALSPSFVSAPRFEISLGRKLHASAGERGARAPNVRRLALRFQGSSLFFTVSRKKKGELKKTTTDIFGGRFTRVRRLRSTNRTKKKKQKILAKTFPRRPVQKSLVNLVLDCKKFFTFKLKVENIPVVNACIFLFVVPSMAFNIRR